MLHCGPVIGCLVSTPQPYWMVLQPLLQVNVRDTKQVLFWQGVQCSLYWYCIERRADPRRPLLGPFATSFTCSFGCETLIRLFRLLITVFQERHNDAKSFSGEKKKKPKSVSSAVRAKCLFFLTRTDNLIRPSHWFFPNPIFIQWQLYTSIPQKPLVIPVSIF